ncbi:MAG: hypothetical protein KGL65_10480, partial [Rhodospirillales bacterium]|nr:hypothetical protein [Rhodospirillales bacterium]
MAAVPGRGKSWVLAMLAPTRGLRVAPVPPKTADLTRPGTAARTVAGRDEGTAVSIEPKNNGRHVFCLAVEDAHRLQSFTQWWVRLIRPHTQKCGHSRDLPFKPGHATRDIHLARRQIVQFR